MPVHRERVDAQRTSDQLLVHRRWLVPDDPARRIDRAALARLWRGLCDLGVLDGGAEVQLERGSGPDGADLERAVSQLPLVASAGALLFAGGTADLVTQMVWLDGVLRDPYRVGKVTEATSELEDFRDYTLYAVADPRRVLVPIPPVLLRCRCGAEASEWGSRFGEGRLLSLDRRCPGCGGAISLGEDRGVLRTGAVFLLEELCCTAALSIELPDPPPDEELPDDEVSALVREALGSTDELADDEVPAAG